MKQELTAFRQIMKEEGIDLYITKDADDHISEYNDRYFSTMEFISGFTGGDGTLVITPDEAGLWTDGRYFIQAAMELEGSGIVLRKEGEPDCPDMENWIRDAVPAGGTVGFDGRCISCNSAERLLRKLRAKKVSVKCDKDLVGKIWTEGRPGKRAEKIWILEEKYAGKSAAQKLESLRTELDSRGAGALLISAMDEVAWLLNLRGDDVPYNPVFDAFFLIDGDLKKLYVSAEHLTDDVTSYLGSLGVEISYDTEEIYCDVSGIRSGTVLADGNSCSYRLLSSLPAEAELINEMDPVELAKNRKNPTEAANLVKAQIKDSIAVTRFMYWFKKALEEQLPLTEMSAAAKLHEFRSQQEGFLGDSFSTISAYGPNAAMCHYEPSEEKPVGILPKSLYLVDSGGHYPEGTTDITRTWSCGGITDEEKKAYTLTAAANLRLADLVFPEGTSGLTLDLAAREIFWENGMDYNHGTGHGVGYLLYVHESPANIRFRANAGTVNNTMEEGVYVSDEPGFYAEGRFGVRLENMVLVEKAFTNGFHTFMKFRTMTLVPFDRSCIDIRLLTEKDRKLYDAYHHKVLEVIGPELPEEERNWLIRMCRPICEDC